MNNEHRRPPMQYQRPPAYIQQASPRPWTMMTPHRRQRRSLSDNNDPHPRITSACGKPAPMDRDDPPTTA
ncbi:hypothetical protein K443DRAFT_14719, partial [Laccaria amethystina LaAM-08-1]